MMNRKLLVTASLLVAIGIALALALSDSSPSRATATLAGAASPTLDSSTCPRVAAGEGTKARTDRNPRARAHFVPSGPISLLLCRYWGFGVHQTPQTQARKGKLEGERVFSHPRVPRYFTRAFNNLRDGLKGAHSCPTTLDEGALVYAIFGYPPGEPNVPVEVDLSDCQEAINGRYETSKWATPSLRHRLEMLTRPQR